MWCRRPGLMERYNKNKYLEGNWQCKSKGGALGRAFDRWRSASVKDRGNGIRNWECGKLKQRAECKEKGERQRLEPRDWKIRRLETVKLRS